MTCTNTAETFRSCDCYDCVELDDLAEDVATRAIAASLANRGDWSVVMRPRKGPRASAKRLASTFCAMGFAGRWTALGRYHAWGPTSAWKVEIWP